MSLLEFHAPDLGSPAEIEADIDRLAGVLRTGAAASPRIDVQMTPRYALHLARRLDDGLAFRDARALLDRIEAAANDLARRERRARADLIAMVFLSAVLGAGILALVLS